MHENRVVFLFILISLLTDPPCFNYCIPIVGGCICCYIIWAANFSLLIPKLVNNDSATYDKYVHFIFLHVAKFRKDLADFSGYQRDLVTL